MSSTLRLVRDDDERLAAPGFTASSHVLTFPSVTMTDEERLRQLKVVDPELAALICATITRRLSREG